MQKKYTWALLALLILVTLPLVGIKEFHTKGEPREAIVAMTMLEQHNWILPTNNGGEMAYKPPFFHWCVAAVSWVTGGVNAWSARVPSALAGVVMLMWMYCFFAKRKYPKTALLAVMVCFTTFEVHRALFACRVDMVLTLGIVGALLAFASWAMKERKGIPWLAILMMSLGTLTKGPVAIALPCGVTFVFLLLRGEKWGKAIGWMTLSALAATLLPLCWYYAAYKQGGQPFLDLIKEENVDRFLGKMTYESHVNPWWYNVIMLVSGLLPWTLIVLGKWGYGLCKDKGFHFKKEHFAPKQMLDKLRNMDPVMLFSMLAAVLIFVFYCIPKSKRGVYLLPVYPFTAWFIAYYIRRWNDKVLKRTSIAFVAVWFLADALVLPLILNPKSDRDIAQDIQEMNLGEPLYSHVPGGAEHNPEHFFSINYYLHDGVGVWPKDGKPEKGYLLIGEQDAEAFQEAHSGYAFQRIYQSKHKSCDTRHLVELYHFSVQPVRSISK